MTAAAGGGWSIERHVDTARALHGPWPAVDQQAHRVVGLCRVDGPPVRRPREHPDDGRRRRRTRRAAMASTSSGGARVVVPCSSRPAPRSGSTSGCRAATRCGTTTSSCRRGGWVRPGRRGLERLGAPGSPCTTAVRIRTDWSDVVCFAGVGPGEVTSPTAKVVGIAQRRTRHGARLHSMALVSWSPTVLLELLSTDAARLRPGVESVAVELERLPPPIFVTSSRPRGVMAMPPSSSPRSRTLCSPRCRDLTRCVH